MFPAATSLTLKLALKVTLPVALSSGYGVLKALPSCMLFSSFISLMADFFQTAHIEDPTYASCFMSPGVYI